MTLKEFLATANADHNLALAEAKAYTSTGGHLIPATTVNQLFAQLDLTGFIKDVAANPAHIARHKMTSVLLSIQGNHDFNFIVGTTAGNGNLAMLDWLISEAMTEQADKLIMFKESVTALANRLIYPFAGASLHDVLLARDVCPSKPVTASNGHITIVTSKSCEKHNPRLMACNPRTSRWQRVNNFMGVEMAGVYDAVVPAQFAAWPLTVDDAYGVI